MSARERETQQFRQELHESQTAVRNLQTKVQKLMEASRKANPAFAEFMQCVHAFCGQGLDQDLQGQDDMPKTHAVGGVRSSTQGQLQSRQVRSAEAEFDDVASEVGKNVSSLHPALTQDSATTITSPTQTPQDTLHLGSSSAPVAAPAPTTTDVTPIALPDPMNSNAAARQDPLPALTAKELDNEDRKIRAYCRSGNNHFVNIAEKLKAKRDARVRAGKAEVANDEQPTMSSIQEKSACVAPPGAESLQPGRDGLQSELKLKASESLDKKASGLGKRKREVSLAMQADPPEACPKRGACLA